jgi:hypothetical protein
VAATVPTVVVTRLGVVAAVVTRLGVVAAVVTRLSAPAAVVTRLSAPAAVVASCHRHDKPGCRRGRSCKRAVVMFAVPSVVVTGLVALPVVVTGLDVLSAVVVTGGHRDDPVFGPHERRGLRAAELDARSAADVVLCGRDGEGRRGSADGRQHGGSGPDCDGSHVSTSHWLGWCFLYRPSGVPATIEPWYYDRPWSWWRKP